MRFPSVTVATPGLRLERKATPGTVSTPRPSAPDRLLAAMTSAWLEDRSLTGEQALEAVRESNPALYAEATAVDVPLAAQAARLEASGDVERFLRLATRIVREEKLSRRQAYEEIRMREPELWARVAATYTTPAP